MEEFQTRSMVLNTDSPLPEISSSHSFLFLNNEL